MLFEELIQIRQRVFTIANGRDFYYGNFIPNLLSEAMFIAEMPSSRKYDPYLNFQISKSDQKFTELLSKHGFGGSYLTDIVKTADKARRPTKNEVTVWVTILLQEIAILRPRVLIAIGDSVYRELLKLNLDLPIEKITHPAYVFSYHGMTEKKYDKEILDLKEKLFLNKKVPHFKGK